MGHLDESYALVSYIVRLAGQNGKLGKKAVQKFVHIVTSLGGVPSRYQFELYTYGPFSRDLAGDLDILDTIEAIEVSYNREKNGYEIQEGSRANELINRHREFISLNDLKIRSIVDRFCGRLAKQLELSSTLLFIIKKNLVEDVSDDERVIEKFSEIKPHYSRQEIATSLKELRHLLD